MKYASVYEKKRSPFWYIVYRDEKGVRRHKATAYRRDNPTGKRHAYDLAMQHSKAAQATNLGKPSERWEAWVADFLRMTYGDRHRTYPSYCNTWSHLSEFLQESGLHSPRALTYQSAAAYLSWRTKQKRHRGTPIHYNTALTELRLLSRLMREAVRCGFADANPIAQLGLGRRPAREKPEITESERALIEKELTTRPEWMQACFQVAIHQGCRLTETAVALRDIDLPKRQITFHAKGSKVFTTALHDGLVPLIERRIELGRTKPGTKLVDLPPMPAKAWHTFFNQIGLGHLSFHSTRVTVVTRLARAGVSQQMAMRFVGHASETVHRVYLRLGVPDLGPALAALR